MKKLVYNKGIMPCILALVMVLAAGCGMRAEHLEPLPFSNNLPPTLAESLLEQSRFTAQLYFVSQDGRTLSPETRELDFGMNKSRAEAAILALIQGPNSDALEACVPAGLSLQRVELSVDACNIYLTGARMPRIREWLVLRAALAATVCGVEEVNSVNVYFNGFEPGYSGRALGSISPISDALDVYLNNLEQEYEVLTNQTGTEAGSFETRTATLYFSDVTGSLLLARNTNINYARNATKPQIAELLVLKLLEGDAGKNSLEPVLPADLELAKAPEFVYKTKLSLPESTAEQAPDEPETLDELILDDLDIDDEAYIIVTLEQPELPYDEQLMCGAITLTLSGYIPKVTGVQIMIQASDGSLTQLGEPGQTYFTRESFSGAIGRDVHIAFPDSEGSALYHVARSVPCVQAYDPHVRLEQLFTGPADPGILYPLFSYADILDVYIVGDTAVVDWAAGFREKFLQMLKLGEDEFPLPTERRELLFVYSVINTLTELPGVQRVWMLEEGKKLGMMDKIYLGNSLMRNPGILVEY